MRIALLCCPLALLLGAGTAMAQQRDDDDDSETWRRAGEIASQPAHDLGAMKREMPPVLAVAADDPYHIADPINCAAIETELGALDAALGPDFDQPAEQRDRAGRLAEAGGKFLINTLLPFRSLVREVSGAAASDRRIEAAVDAGMARRGFLRGIRIAKGCPPPLSAGQAAARLSSTPARQ
ncbi:hypothetical protein [Sphingomonas baiyangensis]|uniref:hypothetical protein n=1 Tax=Sphingomonas baiyangensis TaxID=2572576 RepID=UPI001BB077C5|nr:hypothetical protein [Sphingomonas baiyangensis]